jgi:hypothetical protein
MGVLTEVKSAKVSTKIRLQRRSICNIKQKYYYDVYSKTFNLHFVVLFHLCVTLINQANGSIFQ